MKEAKFRSLVIEDCHSNSGEMPFDLWVSLLHEADNLKAEVTG